MLVLLHVSIALSSIGYTTLLFFYPKAKRFKIAYGLIGATLVTGTYLVISSHSNILSSCETGIGYLAAVSLGLALARKRLATAEQQS